VVVVDDGCRDETRELLAVDYPYVRVVVHPRTLGIARSFNDGVRATTSPIVVLLNDDTEAEPTWLENLCQSLDSGTQFDLAASKLLLYDRRTVLHSAGDFFGRDGVPGNRGVWQVDHGQFDLLGEPFGPCAAAAAYRRSMLDAVGLFDESLGGYCEDVDLSFRAKLAGFRCCYVPTARVYHRLSATGGGTMASFLVGRNTIWVLAQDMPLPLLERYWPRIVVRQLAIAREALGHVREPAARARLRGQIAGFRALGERREGRSAVQRTRRISIPALDASLT
jgi:GT2 family glycosyltransferase